MSELSIKVLKERQDTVRNNWGFIFAFACATLWGICYQGIGFISREGAFGGLTVLGGNPYLFGFCVTLCLTLCVTFFSLLWLTGNGQLREWWCLVTSFRCDNLLCLACALCGGIAAWSTYVIACTVNTTFSVIIVMFYPAIGMMISKRWLNERVSKNLYYGLALIVTGWIILYLPGVSSPQSLSQFPIYLVGALAGIGWGIEGALASRLMETINSSVVVATRYSYESMVVLLIAVGFALFLPDTLTPALTLTIEDSLLVMSIILVVACCLTANYLSWYKSFLLCGVGRGLAVSDVSGFVTVVVGMLLLTSLPSWSAVLACVFMSCGVFIIYSDSTRNAALIRSVDRTPLFVQAAESTMRQTRGHKKMQALLLIALQGPLWDHEVAALLSRDAQKTSTRKRITRQARMHLVEAAAIGIITPIEYAIDSGTYFGEGKLLVCYALTQYGNSRLQKNPPRKRW